MKKNKSPICIYHCKELKCIYRCQNRHIFFTHFVECPFCRVKQLRIDLHNQISEIEFQKWNQES